MLELDACVFRLSGDGGIRSAVRADGRTVSFTAFQDGLLTANVPPETFRKGDNAVVIRTGAAVTLHDLSLFVTGN